MSLSSDADQQDLKDSIPVDIRRRTPTSQSVSKGVKASLYEFVQGNVMGPTLRHRMQEALKSLDETNPVLAEMLLLAAYIHSCRTPL